MTKLHRILLTGPCLALLLVTATGCGNSAANLNSKEAIRKAVVEHLSTRKGLDLDMSAMDLEIGDVSFRTDEAEAAVSFRPKGSQAAAMTMKYQLTREGSAWKVRPKAGGTSHGAGAGAEGAPNPHGGAGSVELPAPLPGAGTAMPPGHPPVAPKQ